MLQGLADLADEVSAGEIRMTPWQSILLPNVARNRAASALGDLAARGFLSSAATGRWPASSPVRVSAGCRSGVADTKSDALAVGNLLDARKVAVFGLHLTGCGKSCAAPRPAPVTLLGVSPGHYDVFLRSDAEAAGFGKLVGRDLTIEQAGALLADKFSLVPE
jgi:precorrin-3B synthase